VAPLPMITVTGHYVDLENQTVGDSYVEFTPLNPVVGDGYLIVGRTVRALIRGGLVTAEIIADSAELSEPLYVLVREVIERTAPTEYVVRPQGTTLDLTTAPRLANPPQGQLYLTAASLGQPNGVARLDANGKVPASELPDDDGGSGGGGGSLQFTQAVAAAVWGPVQHNFGYRPPAVSVFSLDWGTEYGEFQVIHLDSNSLRIAMDTPVPGVALIE
jgi:hypothetical protein